MLMSGLDRVTQAQIEPAAQRKPSLVDVTSFPLPSSAAHDHAYLELRMQLHEEAQCPGDAGTRSGRPSAGSLIGLSAWPLTRSRQSSTDKMQKRERAALNAVRFQNNFFLGSLACDVLNPDCMLQARGCLGGGGL